MRTDHYRQYLRLLVLLLFTLLLNIKVEAKFSARYNEQKPAVIICDWDFPPYEFLNDNGMPAGYTVDLLDEILNNLKVPHVFVMKEGFQGKTDFQLHKADIIIAPNYMLLPYGCAISTTVLSYYRPKILSRTDDPDIRSLKDIPSSKVVVIKTGERFFSNLRYDTLFNFSIEYHAPMEAMTGVANGKYDYFIWGGEALKWKMKELNLENLRISELDIPLAEVHFGGYDAELINAIDDQYARLEQKGDLVFIRDKWFHPERHHDNASPTALYITIGVLMLVLVLFMLNRLVSRNVNRKTLKTSEQGRLMDLAIEMGGYMVMEYDKKRDAFKNIRGHLVDESTTMDDVIASLHPDDLLAFEQKVEELQNTNVNHSDVVLRRNIGTIQQPKWQFITGSCIKEYDDDSDDPTFLLVAKDITREMDEQQSNDELAAKYIKAFDVSMVAMSFYDSDGQLLELNDQMKKLIGVSEKNLKFFNETNLFDVPYFHEVLYKGMRDITHACQHMYYPDLNVDKYVEFRIRPIITENNEIRYYVITVRDVTAERNLYREQQGIERQLQVTNAETSKFEKQMNYLLSNSNMYIWRSHIDTRTIDISRSLRKVEVTFTFDDYIRGIDSEVVGDVCDFFDNPLMHDEPINLVRHYTNSPLTHIEDWFAVSGMPYYDEDDNLMGHFGIIRDVSKLMRSQEELRQETLRAQQSSQLKATFLANMTHEIRTPLNAIVGFSDLLQMVDAPEERNEFIRIIRHNCDLLLRLVDDILETSEMIQKPQSIEAEEFDFSSFFAKEVCQIIKQRMQESDVEFISDNPFETFPVKTDRERIHQVITNFVTNALKYTQKGYVKLGYRKETRDDVEGIYIYCEDTGVGIPKEKQSTIFDRFVKLNDYVQGTGLGLSICKSIADRCHGQIGVISEGEGKGSTFWLWIPRFLTSNNLTAEK